MKLNKTIYALCLLVGAAVTSCSEDSGLIGVNSAETISTSMSVYDVITWSDSLTSVKANTSSTYLGCIYDPEIRTRITSSYATQFAIIEDLTYFPDSSLMVSRDADGRPTCDSVVLQLYYDKYYGDKNAPIKVAVYPLKKGELRYDSVYYTTDNLKLMADTTVKYSKVVTAYDRVNGIDPDNASSYPSVSIALPNSFGQMFMDKYWEYVNNPNDPVKGKYYQDSYHFVRDVFPGFYVETESGEGVMMSVFVSDIYMYFRAKPNADSEPLNGYASFAGTQEVLQSTSVRHENLKELVEDESQTWLKTPAGICTLAELPVLDIMQGHETDSLNQIRFMLQRYVNDVDRQETDYFEIPQTLLLLRQSEMNDFFAENKLPDGKLQHLATYSESYNTYEFDNISSLVSDMYRDYKEKTEAGEEVDPTWNRVCLVPVSTSTDSSTGSVTNVKHDLSLASARLVKGTEENPIKIQVYYSKVEKRQ